MNSVPQPKKIISNLVSGNKRSNVLLSLDDVQLEIEEYVDFFTKRLSIFTHHYYISCIGVLHKLFGKQLRTISLNTPQVILTENV